LDYESIVLFVAVALVVVVIVVAVAVAAEAEDLCFPTLTVQRITSMLKEGRMLS